MRPISPKVLVEELVERIHATAAPWVRVAVDGAPAALPGELADALVEPLKALGRPVVRVSAADFLRPASLRLEYGRTDPDVFYTDWLDVKALAREVVGPLAPGGSGRVLPALWDSARDRAFRVPYEELPARGVLLLDGALLLATGLEFEVTVHLWLSQGALARRTPEADRWQLPAFARYDRERAPADVTVKVDDPRHPATLE
ncbi:uridine kinase [Nonomuraea sp. NPDC050556]|uniref:uridine kinase n=1 Tax=Nonomuraea sp. NPDC050556 TaxID=3364369 RepID=UPI00378F923F